MLRRSRIWLALTCIGYLSAAGTVDAHHSFGTFDLNRNVEIVGTIAGIDFVNPHAWVRVDTRNLDGSVSTYRCEMRGATVLRRSGWTPELFVAGAPITVQGAPDREDPLACYVNTLVLADGRTLDRYTQRVIEPAAASARVTAPVNEMPRLPSGVPNLVGDWAVEQQLMTDPRGRLGTLVPASKASQFEVGAVPEGGIAMPGSEGTGPLSLVAAIYRISVGAISPRVVPWLDQPIALTERGASAAALATTSAQHPQMRCETTSIIFNWYIETLVNRITQSDAAVTIEYGQGLVRTIHLHAAHPPNLEPSRAGHSVGRWENDVLVVDTVGFLPGMLAIEIAHGEGLHVVERFSLNSNGTVLTRDYTATDPDYFVGDYKGTDVTPRSPVPFVVDTCDAALNPVVASPLE
jgi:hypothetical protein